MTSQNNRSHSQYESDHPRMPEIVLPEVIITRPRIQWMPHSKKGGRISVDISALQNSLPPDSNLDFTSHPRYSSYYASSTPLSYRERFFTSYPQQTEHPLSTIQPIILHPQQHIPPAIAPTRPRQHSQSHTIQRFTNMNVVDGGSPQALAASGRRASGSRRNTAASGANTTCKENHTSQRPQPASQPAGQEHLTLSKLAYEALKFTDPAKYRRRMVEAHRAMSGAFLPSVLDPKITIKEISYDDAIAAITKDTGPLLMNLKNIPSRPVDIVLYDPKGSSLAVFTLLLTREVDLIWLISWIQIFVDKWVQNEDRREILVVQSLKIRMASKVETESYPPLKGTPVDRTQRETTGPFKGFYFMKWDCHDSQMEKYWKVFRCMLQMGAGDPQKPIFKVYTIGFPLETAPVNLRNQKSLAPCQYFESARTGFPLLSEDFFGECNDKIGYARMTSSSEAAFVARELQMADDTRSAQMGRALAILPSASSAPNKGAESYGVRGSNANSKARCTVHEKAGSSHAFPRNKIVSLPMDFAGSAEEQSYIKNPQDKWVTITTNGGSLRVFAPFRIPVSHDPARVWSYYQKWGGGNLEWQAAFNLDDIPFEIDQFPSYKVVNGIAVNLNSDGKVNSDEASVTGGSPITFGRGLSGTFESSATLAGQEVNYNTSVYDQNTAIGKERLLCYQKEFEAATGFDSKDDDIYFPKRGQPPSPPKVETFKPIDRWLERKKLHLQLQPVQFVNERKKGINVPRPQQQFSTFVANSRQEDPSITFAHYKSNQDRIESPVQPFPQWDNPQSFHDSPATGKLISATCTNLFTAMNPDAPSFQVNCQPDSSLQLNANAANFLQSTVSVPPHRIVPPGYGDMTPISGTSPTISRTQSQISLSNQNFQTCPSVDSLTSGISNMHGNSGTFNASGHNFDHFSRLNQDSSPRKSNPNTYWCKSAGYTSQAAVLGNSFRSVACGSKDDGSNFQHSQIQNQARNPHITSLNQRLQARGQLQARVRERPDRSRTFDRDSRQHAGNRGYGSDLSDMTGSQTAFSRVIGSGSKYQSMSFGAGKGNTKHNVMHTNQMAASYRVQLNPNTSNQLQSNCYSVHNVQLASAQKSHRDISRARSSSPQKVSRPGFSTRASDTSYDAIESKKSSKLQEEEALKAIVGNFQTQVVRLQPQSGEMEPDAVFEQKATPDHLEVGPVAASIHRQINISSSETGLKPKDSPLALDIGILGVNFAFCPVSCDNSKFGNAEGFDFEKMSRLPQSRAFYPELADAKKGFGSDMLSNNTPVPAFKGEHVQQANFNFDRNKWKSPAPATVATSNANATGIISNVADEQ